MAPRRPTILQIIPELDTGGAELSSIEIAEAIVSGGGRALIASEGGEMAAQVSGVGGELIFFPAATKNPWSIWRNATRLQKLITDENVDLLHARSRAPAWSTWIASQRENLPFVTTYHGAYSEKNALKKRYNEVMAQGDIVIANSQYTSNLVQSRYGTAESKLRVVYRGLDPERYNRKAIDDQRIAKLKTAWKIAPNQRIVLNVARLTHWKGQPVIIDAAKRLKADGLLEDVVFVFAGSHQSRTRYDSQLKDKISDAGLQSHFRFAGHVDDVPAALATAFLSVVASTEPEAFGRAAAEAQAMECPVVSTNIGAPPETVLAKPAYDAEKVTGWLIPPSDSQALASVIAEALSLSPEASKAMGQRGRVHVATNFSLNAMKLKTLNVYDELLGSQMSEKFTENNGS